MTRRAWVLVGFGVLVVAVAAGVLAWVLTRPPSAEEAAQRYLDALAAGDFDAVAQLREPPLDPEREAVLAEAFAGALRATDPQVEEIDVDGERAGVRASMDFAGQRLPVFFGLGLQDGRWMLTADYLATLEVTTSLGDAVWVGDALVSPGPVTLLPAVYPVVPAPREVLTGGVDVAVSNDVPVTVHVEAALAPDAAALVTAQLEPYLAACTGPAAALPENCGIRVPWAADLVALEGVAFRIDTAPAVALDPEARTFAATGGVLVATARGTSHAGAPAEFTYRTDDWTLYGDLTFTGDELVIAVR